MLIKSVLHQPQRWLQDQIVSCELVINNFIASTCYN